MSGSAPPLGGDRRWLVAPLVLALAAIVVAVMISSSSAQPDGSEVLTVQSATTGPAMPPGFVGLSMEFRGLEAYAGMDPKALDPVFVALVRNLAPDQSPVLRIGGDGTDWTWYPPAHVPKPPGVKYSLDQRWLQVARALAQALGARLILGINLEAGSRAVASAEARAFTGGIGRGSISALEIGNEPELYGSFGWYKSASGVQVTGRPPGYSFQDYLLDFSSFAAALPGVPLAGPSSGAPKYMAKLGAFLSREPRVKLVTLHAYPLKHCTSTTHITIGQLLSDTASSGLADKLAPLVSVARRHGATVRIDELNAISCGGQHGVSDTFASSLWALDTLFELARAGVTGVNIHTVPKTINAVIGTQLVNGHWQGVVHPEYYGMMMFAQAAPPGSRLLRLSFSSATAVEAWATRATDGVTRVVLINRQGGAQTVKVRLPAVSASATLERLQAPSVQARSGVTLGGQSFGTPTATGGPAGPATSTPLTPVSGSYTVTLPAAGAALLTVPSR